MSVYDFLADREGTLGTKWGPCVCPSSARGHEPGTCVACVWAADLEARGLDYQTESGRARVARYRAEMTLHTCGNSDRCVACDLRRILDEEDA